MTPDRLRSLALLIETIGRPAAVLGGLAVAVHGRPRTTRDADVTVDASPDELAALLSAADQAGFEARVPDLEAFVEATRVLPLCRRTDRWEVDLILAGTPYEREALGRASLAPISGVSLPVLSAEDLLVHKILAGRPRDIEDARSVVRARGARLDREHVRSLLLELAEALADDELRRRVDSLLPG